MRPEHLRPPRDLEALAAQVLALTSQVAALKSDVAALQAIVARPAGTLNRRVRDHLTRVLPAWASALGSDPVMVREVLLFDHPALKLALDGLTAKVLGKCLQSAVGHPVGGFMVERVGDEGGVALWRVLALVS